MVSKSSVITLGELELRIDGKLEEEVTQELKFALSKLSPEALSFFMELGPHTLMAVSQVKQGGALREFKELEALGLVHSHHVSRDDVSPIPPEANMEKEDLTVFRLSPLGQEAYKFIQSLLLELIK